MMKKKGVSDVIATILIILLVLAAIIIVWQVVSKVVKGGATTVEERSKCIDVSLDFVGGGVSCNKTSPGLIAAKVKRGSDNLKTTVGMKIVVEDKITPQENAPDALLQKSATIPADINATGKSSITIKVAPVVGENTDIVCDPTDEVTVTCTS